MSETWSALILTGGSSTRFGSDKSVALLGGQTLLSHLLTTLAGNIEVVIVGPPFDFETRKLNFVQENPMGGGPVAAVSAGLAEIKSEFVALIATDMPYATAVVNHLTQSLLHCDDGVVPMDAEGVPQTLCAIYRANALREAIIKLGDPHGRSMRALTSLLQLKYIDLSAELKSRLLDIDTPADLQRAIATNVSIKEDEIDGEN